MSKHPNNGPTLFKPTIKKPRPNPPFPEREQVAQEQTARNSAWGRRFRTLINKDKDAWYDEYFGKKDG